MHDSNTSESLILRLANPTDGIAWSEFLQIYEPMLLRLCQRWGLQDADSREVVQDTLLAVAKAVESFQPDRPAGSFRAWLKAITRHKLVDHLDSRSRQVRGSGDTDVLRWLNEQSKPDAADSVWEYQQKQQVFEWAAQRVRGQVSSLTWLAFQRTSVEGVSIADAAQELGIREGLVYVARSRVMSRLQKAVQTWLTQEAER